MKMNLCLQVTQGFFFFELNNHDLYTSFKLPWHRQAIRKLPERTAQPIFFELNNGVIAIALRNEQRHRQEVLQLKLLLRISGKMKFNLNCLSHQQLLENNCSGKWNVVEILETVWWSR